MRRVIIHNHMPAPPRVGDAGYVVSRIGQYQIIEGSGPDGGDWFAKGGGENKRFKSRKLAEEHAHASSEDSARAVGDWNAYPSYTLAELEATVAAGTSPNIEKIKAEIAARKNGTSVQRVTPQVAPMAGSRPISKLGRM